MLINNAGMTGGNGPTRALDSDGCSFGTGAVFGVWGGRACY
ncbi:MAG TPA: hypothetical protein VGO37_11195 [Steroidobacteraceae bacterium]|nr:hypothetical protein [Steroidobacteraceae bacterium]